MSMDHYYKTSQVFLARLLHYTQTNIQGKILQSFLLKMCSNTNLNTLLLWYEDVQYFMY